MRTNEKRACMPVFGRLPALVVGAAGRNYKNLNVPTIVSNTPRTRVSSNWLKL